MEHNEKIVFPFLLRLFSFVTIGFGVIIGTVFIDENIQFGLGMIFFSIVSGMILLSLAIILQRLHDGKEKVTVEKVDQVDRQEDKVGKPAIEKENTEQSNQEEVDRKRLIEYYRQTEGQDVEEILATPMESIYVVKVEDYIDVIEINRFHPKLFNEEDVEKRPQLKKWIEKNIFN